MGYFYVLIVALLTGPMWGALAFALVWQYRFFKSYSARCDGDAPEPARWEEVKSYRRIPPVFSNHRVKARYPIE